MSVPEKLLLPAIMTSHAQGQATWRCTFCKRLAAARSDAGGALVSGVARGNRGYIQIKSSGLDQRRFSLGTSVLRSPEGSGIHYTPPSKFVNPCEIYQTLRPPNGIPVIFEGLSEAAKAAEMERRASTRGRAPEKTTGMPFGDKV